MKKYMDDQGLNHIAFYPTEACLVKMLYRAGFSSVLRPVRDPEHSHYYSHSRARRVRTILAAAHELVDSKQLARVAEVSSAIRALGSDEWNQTGRRSSEAQALRGEVSVGQSESVKRIIKAG